MSVQKKLTPRLEALERRDVPTAIVVLMDTGSDPVPADATALVVVPYDFSTGQPTGADTSSSQHGTGMAQYAHDAGADVVISLKCGSERIDPWAVLRAAQWAAACRRAVPSSVGMAVEWSFAAAAPGGDPLLVQAAAILAGAGLPVAASAGVDGAYVPSHLYGPSVLTVNALDPGGVPEPYAARGPGVDLGVILPEPSGGDSRAAAVAAARLARADALDPWHQPEWAVAVVRAGYGE